MYVGETERRMLSRGLHTNSHIVCQLPTPLLGENVPGSQWAVLSKQLQWQKPDFSVGEGTTPLWPAKSCERKPTKKSRFSSQLTLIQSENNHLKKIPVEGFSYVVQKTRKKTWRWQLLSPWDAWWVLFTVVWLVLLRGYKLPWVQSWIPTRAWGIQPGTLSVSGFDTVVWVPNAS